MILRRVQSPEGKDVCVVGRAEPPRVMPQWQFNEVPADVADHVYGRGIAADILKTDLHRVAAGC